MAAPKGRPKPEGSGRKKGTTNGDVSKLRGLILGALDARGGQEWLEQQMDEQPVAFMNMVSKCLPKEVVAELSGKVEIQSITRRIIDEKIDRTDRNR